MIALAASFLHISAYAQNADVTLSVSESGLHTSYTDNDGGAAVLSFYDADDRLIFSTAAAAEEGVYTFNVDESYYDDYARISYIGGSIYDAEIEADEPESEVTDAPVKTPAPAVSPSPVPTEKPVPTEDAADGNNTDKPSKTPYPEVYKNNVDAINAPMVVKENEVILVDGEEYYNLTVLYQSAETIISVKNSVEIKTAPDSASYLKGKDASVLEEGDIIRMTAYLSGAIKSIDFIYRPEKTDYVKSDYDGGVDFKQLYSSNGSVAGGWNAIGYNSENVTGDGYIFGVPVKSEKGYVLLANKEGEVTEAAIASGTIVYTVNNAIKNNKVEFTGFGYGAIAQTFVPQKDFYESNIDWTDVDDITYALLRITDGVATDIVVFTN